MWDCIACSFRARRGGRRRPHAYKKAWTASLHGGNSRLWTACCTCKQRNSPRNMREPSPLVSAQLLNCPDSELQKQELCSLWLSKLRLRCNSSKLQHRQAKLYIFRLIVKSIFQRHSFSPRHQWRVNPDHQCQVSGSRCPFAAF